MWAPETQARKRSSSAPLPAAKGQRTLFGMLASNSASSSRSSSSSSSSSNLEAQHKPQRKPQPKPQPKPEPKPQPKPEPKPQAKPQRKSKSAKGKSKPQPNPVEPSTEKEYTAEEVARENKKTEDDILQHLLAVSKNLAHLLRPVYDDGKGGGIQWWVKRCRSTCVRFPSCTDGCRCRNIGGILDEVRAPRAPRP